MNPAIFEGPHEINNLATYVHQMMIRKKSSELCLSRLLGLFAFTQKSLETDLGQLNATPMAFMYGEYDWVNRATADKLIESGVIQGEVFQTADSGHHLYVEAAEECVACILKFVKGKTVADAFI